MPLLREGVDRWVKEFDAAQRLTGEARRKAEAMAASRLRGWIMREYPEDQSDQTRVSGRFAPRESVAPATGAASPPFVAAEYVGLPGDRILFVAHDPHTGICCAGRESSDEADYDAQGLRAAWRLGYATAMGAVMRRLGYSVEIAVDREPTYAEWMRDERRIAIDALGLMA